MLSGASNHKNANDFLTSGCTWTSLSLCFSLFNSSSFSVAVFQSWTVCRVVDRNGYLSDCELKLMGNWEGCVCA